MVPVDMGFDEAFFILSSLDMPPYLYLRNDRAIEVPTVDRGFPHNEYNDYQRVGAAAEDFDPGTCLADFAAESRKVIKTQSADESGNPFFLYLALNSPHTPITPGKAFKGKYPQYSWYADFVAETDWVVGEVLAQLQESGVDENTPRDLHRRQRVRPLRQDSENVCGRVQALGRFAWLEGHHL